MCDKSNAKTWAIDKVNEIKSTVDDLKYVKNEWLQQQAILHIEFWESEVQKHFNMILFTNDKEKFNRYKYARNILEKLLEEE